MNYPVYFNLALMAFSVIGVLAFLCGEIIDPGMA